MTRRDGTGDQVPQLVGLGAAGSLEGGDDRHGPLPLPQVAAHRLAGRRRVAPDPEQVVDRLEGQSEIAAVVAQGADRRTRRPGQDGAHRGRTAQEGAGLGRGHGHALLDGYVPSALEGHVVGLTGDHGGRGVGQRRRRGGAAPDGSFEEDLVSEDLQGVAGDDRRPDPVHRPHRRPVMPFGVDVDDVIVDEREVVDQLHRHRPGHADLGVGPGGFGGQDGQGGPDALAARAS